MAIQFAIEDEDRKLIDLEDFYKELSLVFGYEHASNKELEMISIFTDAVLRMHMRQEKDIMVVLDSKLSGIDWYKEERDNFVEVFKNKTVKTWRN